jgi:hypothetical protein
MEKLIMLDGMVAVVIGNGSAFVDTENGDQIYVPGRQVDIMKVDAGDTVRCWCLHNDPEHSHTAKYRSIRSMVINRLTDTMDKPVNAMAEALSGSLGQHQALPGTEVAEPQTAAPATSFPAIPKAVHPLEGSDLTDLVDVIMDRPFIFTTKDVHSLICSERPEYWGDPKLLSRVTHVLNAMNAHGEICVIKVYREGDQSSATAVLYARSPELALRIMQNGGST